MNILQPSDLIQSNARINNQKGDWTKIDYTEIYSKEMKLVLTFTLTWLTQFFVYWLRKPIGVLKIYVGNEMELTNSQMGALDIR